MKIYKVTLDPSNPVEKIVKVPVGSNYGIQINWDYEKFPTFTNSDVDTENGKLTYTDGVIKENTSFTDVNGQKIFTNLPVIENVGNTIIFAYGKDETFDENKLDNFGSIKVVGIDTDDYDVDVSGGTDGAVDGLYNIPVEVGTEFELTPLKTVYKTIPESASTLAWSVPSDMPTNAIITFWFWIVMGDTAYELTFPTSVTFIDNAPTFAANTETMLALTSTDGGTTWLANTQWVK